MLCNRHFPRAAQSINDDGCGGTAVAVDAIAAAAVVVDAVAVAGSFFTHAEFLLPIFVGGGLNQVLDRNYIEGFAQRKFVGFFSVSFTSFFSQPCSFHSKVSLRRVLHWGEVGW